MIKVAITGNIASGKSEFEKYLKSLDFMVFDADKISHEILENSDEIFEIFDKSDITTNLKIDRQKIAKIVFNDEKKMRELENIIHPLVKQKIFKIFEDYKEEKAVFVSVPQLFEAGFEELFDKIIFISAEKHIRLERLIKRNNFSKEVALKRIEAQIPENEKISKCNYVINNNSDTKSLQIHANSILEKLLK